MSLDALLGGGVVTGLLVPTFGFFLNRIIASYDRKHADTTEEVHKLITEVQNIRIEIAKITTTIAMYIKENHK
jgi:hypothetical protein